MVTLPTCMFGSLVANAKRMSKMNLNFWDQDLEVGILLVPGAVSRGETK